MNSSIATNEKHIVDDVYNQSSLIFNLLIPDILNKIHKLHKSSNEHIELYHQLFWTCAKDELNRLKLITLDNQTKLDAIKGRFESTFEHVNEIDDVMYSYEVSIEEASTMINSLLTSLELEISSLEKHI